MRLRKINLKESRKCISKDSKEGYKTLKIIRNNTNNGNKT